MQRVLRIILGSLLIVLGLAGLVLPFLQGWLFLGLGAFVLSRDVPVFARMFEWISGRFPRAGRAMQRILKTIPVIAD